MNEDEPKKDIGRSALRGSGAGAMMGLIAATAISSSNTMVLTCPEGYAPIRIPARLRQSRYDPRKDSVYANMPTPPSTYREVDGKDRNRPCACGSGKKAKKCNCGGALAQIVKYDHPALSTVAEPCTPEDLKDPKFTLLEAACIKSRTGVGIAANQVGWLKRVIYLRPDKKNGYFMINPVVVRSSDTYATFEEGCLSYPDTYAPIDRPDWVIVKWLDREWKEHERRFEGFDAVVVQHEIDHINGICRVGEVWFQRKMEAA